MTDTPDNGASRLESLAALARIAEAMLDGEDAKRILTDDAMAYLDKPHPRYRHLPGDHYDVDHGRFLRVKKLLLRLATLVDFDLNASVLVPISELDQVTVALHTGTTFRYCAQFGQLSAELPAVVADVFKDGVIRGVPPDDASPLATALAPVRDSLGDVVAVVELSACPPASPESTSSPS